MGVGTHQSPRLKRQLSGSDDEGEGMEVGGEEGGGEEGGEASSSFTTKKHCTEQPDNTGTLEPEYRYPGTRIYTGTLEPEYRYPGTRIQVPWDQNTGTLEPEYRYPGTRIQVPWDQTQYSTT